MKRVSVCLATYNGASFIEEQIASILIQLGANDEVIVSDDSSTDDTLKIIKSFNDDRISILPGQTFKSAVFNFEHALKHAKGEYIFLSDQDDVWKLNKVDRILHELREADLVVSNCDFIDGNGRQIGVSYFDLYKAGPGVLKNFIKNSYLGNCMAFNRHVLQRILPFPKQLEKTSKMLLFHDVWIGLIGNIFFKVKFLPETLSSYRRHSGNASPTEINATSPNGLIIKVRSRLLITTALVNRIVRRT
ncbi:glycosyltransferase family 2 protein [Spirosoma oryzae]|nr:glycosyltransferase family 2 protein [Spirosoma oryzae]